MIITKILNNNVVVVEGNQKEEKIILGKGVGFNKKRGDEVDSKLVEKSFLLERQNTNEIELLFSEISYEYFDVSSSIVDMIKEVNKEVEFKDSLKITLADHLHGVVQRIKSPNYKPLQNMLLWDLKHFYDAEFQIAKESNKLIKQHFGIELNDDELGFLVLHLLNAQLNDQGKIEDVSKIIKEISQIIRLNLNIEFNTNSYDYNRLIQHLKYFGLRLIKSDKSHNVGDNNQINDSFYDFIKSEYPVAFKISQKVSDYLMNQYKYNVNHNEVIYLTIHIQRLISK